MKKTKTTISIIIVNYNGLKWLKACFDSIENQTYRNYEVIFVDNNSIDTSIEFVKKNYPKIKIVQSRENSGFAGGNNLGYKQSSGEIIILLNNDTVLPKTYLSDFNKAFNDQEVAIAQSKIILLNEKNKLDSCGSLWTKMTLLYHIGCGRDPENERYNKKMLLFSVKGASMAIRRKVIRKIGLFDDTAWCYYEESDFCHRAWVAGYKSWYYPSAYCYHASGGTSLGFKNDKIQFHNFKNHLASYIKNFELKTLIAVIPTFVILNIALSIIWLFQGKLSLIWSLIKAFGWNIKNLRLNLIKRKRIQKQRKFSDRQIIKLTLKSPKLTYYFYSFFGIQSHDE